MGKALGHNPLDTFLSVLSDECQLSQHYTNHCIRVSGILNFKRNNFSDRQVMAVSGHKSLQSLALYTRVHDNEKMMMSLKLTFSYLKPEEACKLQENTDESVPAIEGGETVEPPTKKKKMRPIMPKLTSEEHQIPVQTSSISLPLLFQLTFHSLALPMPWIHKTKISYH